MCILGHHGPCQQSRPARVDPNFYYEGLFFLIFHPFLVLSGFHIDFSLNFLPFKLILDEFLP